MKFAASLLIATATAFSQPHSSQRHRPAWAHGRGGNDDGQDFDMLMGMITDLNERFDELSCAIPIVDFFFTNEDGFDVNDANEVFWELCVEEGQTVELLFEIAKAPTNAADEPTVVLIIGNLGDDD